VRVCSKMDNDDDNAENLPLENKWCFWFDKGQKQKLGGVRVPPSFLRTKFAGGFTQDFFFFHGFCF
jgi:hypothetical protein